ncbi:hypothetical protein ABK040_000385 [Willaertia magna]
MKKLKLININISFRNKTGASSGFCSTFQKGIKDISFFNKNLKFNIHINITDKSEGDTKNNYSQSFNLKHDSLFLQQVETLEEKYDDLQKCLQIEYPQFLLTKKPMPSKIFEKINNVIQSDIDIKFIEQLLTTEQDNLNLLTNNDDSLYLFLVLNQTHNSFDLLCHYQSKLNLIDDSSKIVIKEIIKNYSILKKEHPNFNEWFEDLETNLPLNLNSMIKLVEAFLVYPNKESIEIIDESLTIDPNNFYALLIKSDTLKLLFNLNKNIKDLSIDTINSCERENVEKRNSYLKTALNCLNNGDFLLDGMFWLLKGHCYFYLEKYKDAIDCYNKVKNYPHDLLPNSSVIIDSVAYTFNSLLKLGKDKRILLKELNENLKKYNNNSRLVLEKHRIESQSCLSKDELRAVKRKLENYIKEMSIKKNEIVSQLYINIANDIIKDIDNEIINNLNLPERNVIEYIKFCAVVFLILFFILIIYNK